MNLKGGYSLCALVADIVAGGQGRGIETEAESVGISDLVVLEAQVIGVRDDGHPDGAFWVCDGVQPSSGIVVIFFVDLVLDRLDLFSSNKLGQEFLCVFGGEFLHPNMGV